MEWLYGAAPWLRILVLSFNLLIMISLFITKKFSLQIFILSIAIPIVHLILFFAPPYKPETIISLFLSLGCIAFGIRIIINQFKNT